MQAGSLWSLPLFNSLLIVFFKYDACKIGIFS